MSSHSVMTRERAAILVVSGEGTSRGRLSTVMPLKCRAAPIAEGLARADRPPVVLGVGDLLVLPPNAPCRAYRWQHERAEATIFFAAYPLALRTTDARTLAGAMAG